MGTHATGIFYIVTVYAVRPRATLFAQSNILSMAVLCVYVCRCARSLLLSPFIHIGTNIIMVSVLVCICASVTDVTHPLKNKQTRDVLLWIFFPSI